MKIRLGFVTNSSSSSFLLCFETDDRDKIKEILLKDLPSVFNKETREKLSDRILKHKTEDLDEVINFIAEDLYSNEMYDYYYDDEDDCRELSDEEIDERIALKKKEYSEIVKNYKSFSLMDIYGGGSDHIDELLSCCILEGFPHVLKCRIGG